MGKNSKAYFHLAIGIMLVLMLVGCSKSPQSERAVNILATKKLLDVMLPETARWSEPNLKIVFTRKAEREHSDATNILYSALYLNIKSVDVEVNHRWITVYSAATTEKKLQERMVFIDPAGRRLVKEPSVAGSDQIIIPALSPGQSTTLGELDAPIGNFTNIRIYLNDGNFFTTSVGRTPVALEREHEAKGDIEIENERHTVVPIENGHLTTVYLETDEESVKYEDDIGGYVLEAEAELRNFTIEPIRRGCKFKSCLIQEILVPAIVR